MTRARATHRRIAFSIALFATSLIVAMRIGTSLAADGLAAPSAPQAATPTPHPAPVTSIIEWRWQTKLVELPGVVRRDRTGHLLLQVLLPEGSPAPMLGVGDGAQVAIESLGLTLSGAVAHAGAAGEPGRFSIEIELPADPRLRPDLAGKLQMMVRGRKVVAVPAAAVIRKGQTLSVVRIDERGDQETVPVTLGASFEDGELEVVSGLARGDTVLLAPGDAQP